MFWIATFSGIFLVALLLSGPRSQGIVMAAVGLEVIVTIGWALFVWFSAMPCGLSGTGILEPTPQCPVETLHVVSVSVGGPSCLALLVSIAAGLLYAYDGREAARRVFQIALAVAAVLILVWVGADATWPLAHHASD
jgi:hypothetical protein